MKIKKSCNGCRAFDYGCTLGYDTKSIQIWSQEPCIYEPL